VAAACLVFVLAMGELGATVVVAPPGSQTLTLRIYNYMHYGASDAVAALCLAMAAVAVLAGAAAALALAGWSRAGGRAAGVP
jgi:iron(III) transport system permease protein